MLTFLLILLILRFYNYLYILFKIFSIKPKSSISRLYTFPNGSTLRAKTK